MTKVLAPVMFFGTDEVRNEGVKDFRPTNMSAVKAEMEANNQDGAAGDDESPKESALDSARSSHPSVQESLENPVTAVSVPVQSPQETVQDQDLSLKPAPSHPDLDF